MTNPDPTQPPADLPVYQAVVARRLQWDALLWQVPALSLAAQAFLLTIALSPDSGRATRVITSGLAIVAAFLSLHLLIRHRQAELADAHWLADYEQRHFSTIAHGPQWRDCRNAIRISGPLGRLAMLPAFPVWQAALGLFGGAAVVVFLAAFVGLGLFR
jgi:hypothetical protein